jgi:hypothetical protein
MRSLVVCLIYRSIRLSEFTINSKNKSTKIINRIPDYGDGRREGCIIMPQIRVELQTQADTLIFGRVTDVDTRKPLIGANVKSISKAGIETRLTTDSLGAFKFAGRLRHLEVSLLGYRNFTARL